MTTLTKEQVEHFREPLKRQIRRDTILHIPISDEMKAVDQLIDLALRGLEVTQEDETAWLVEAFSGQTENYFAGLDEIWNGGFSLYPRWTDKPHGRKARTLLVYCGQTHMDVDLSVMPTRPATLTIEEKDDA